MGERRRERVDGFGRKQARRTLGITVRRVDWSHPVLATGAGFRETLSAMGISLRRVHSWNSTNERVR